MRVKCHLKAAIHSNALLSIRYCLNYSRDHTEVLSSADHFCITWPLSKLSIINAAVMDQNHSVLKCCCRQRQLNIKSQISNRKDQMLSKFYLLA